MIATLSAGMVDNPLLPVRDGILDGPGTLERRLLVPARVPLEESDRLVEEPEAIPADLRLRLEDDLLVPVDDLLPTLLSSLILKSCDFKDGRLVCFCIIDLRLLARLLAVVGLAPALPTVFDDWPFDENAAASISSSDALSISSARSTSGAFTLRSFCGGVCVLAALVGDLAAVRVATATVFFCLVVVDPRVDLLVPAELPLIATADAGLVFTGDLLLPCEAADVLVVNNDVDVVVVVALTGDLLLAVLIGDLLLEAGAAAAADITGDLLLAAVPLTGDLLLAAVALTGDLLLLLVVRE
mmetsp:Transcript_27788/g.61833  ORF Transcript_27788/g.61833 Transcript_27788/m.61833 type:complete len:299 (+) Transcript_27788:1654-2550(+)